MNQPFADFYRGKTVLVTGDTGFKGSWLAVWLNHLGATVIGYALEPPSKPSNFTASCLEQRITHVYGDVRDYGCLEKTFQHYQPEIVFHLAAQSLVRLSYEKAQYTFDVNVMGTVNMLEAARRTDSVKAVVTITSDKCYRNVGWEWGYRETDPLGGYDAYSASKACAELAIAVYQHSTFQQVANPVSDLAIASTRAGNVIGGGDWAGDRIVPDTIRAIAAGRDVIVRNPDATRPWQHVLEPLSAYLWLGMLLTKDCSYCTSWNIGPSDTQVLTVRQVVTAILQKWSTASRLVVEPGDSQTEALLLRLDCSKAAHHLKWRTTLAMDQTLDAIVSWYKRFYTSNGEDMYSFTVHQIEEYTECARRLNLSWACAGVMGI